MTRTLPHDQLNYWCRSVRAATRGFQLHDRRRWQWSDRSDGSGRVTPSLSGLGAVPWPRRLLQAASAGGGKTHPSLQAVCEVEDVRASDGILNAMRQARWDPFAATASALALIMLLVYLWVIRQQQEGAPAAWAVAASSLVPLLQGWAPSWPFHTVGFSRTCCCRPHPAGIAGHPHHWAPDPRGGNSLHRRRMEVAAGARRLIADRFLNSVTAERRRNVSALAVLRAASCP